MNGAQINKFLKGIITDVDVSLIDTTQWVFPTINLRIFNKDGQGYVATNTKGNEYDESSKIGFKITDNYVVLGAYEIGGIAYIVSAHKDCDQSGHNYGLGEIGCYPSPIAWSSTNDEFERTYKPLHNYFTASRTNLRTGNFKFSLYNQVQVIAKKSYDNSVDLYLADNLNPNLVINTGFKISGEETSRLIYAADFAGKLHQITSSDTPPLGGLVAVETGGSNKPGMYYLYLRYLTEDYNATGFVTELGPIQVSPGEHNWNVEGMQEKNWIDDTFNITNKKIVVNISNIDTSFTYLEVGVVRYSSDTENGVAIQNVYLVDKYYNVEDIDNDGYLTIYGIEGESDLTIAEILQTNIDYKTCKDHVALNNRYKGVNWKGPEYDVEALKEYARLITIGYNCNTDVDDKTYAELNLSSSGELYQYKGYDDVYSYLGHFRGEIYPYSVIFQLTGGIETEAFPITGNDDYFATTLNPNEKGLYRFPMWNSVHAVGTNINDNRFIMGVKFNNTQSLGYLSANTTKFSNVIGFYYVRGERVKNMLGQGLMMRCYDGVQHCVSNPTTLYFGEDQGDRTSIPMYRGLIPIAAKLGANYYYNNAYPNATGVYSSSIQSSNRYGIYVPDHILGNINIPNNLIVRPIIEHSNQTNGEYIFPTHLGCDYTMPNVLTLSVLTNPSASDDLYYTASANDIPKATNRPGNGFSSFYGDGENDEARRAFYQNGGLGLCGGGAVDEIYNRSMFSLPYVGIVETTTVKGLPNYINDTVGTLKIPVVSLYKSENNAAYYSNIVASYSINNKEFTKISGLIDIDADTSSNVYFKGDCFLQRTFFRIMRWYDKDDLTGYCATNSILYQHGLLVSFISENAVNTAMRNEVKTITSSEEVLTYSYFPKIKERSFDAEDWIVHDDSNVMLYEALQVNDGFNKVEGGKKYYGVDINRPESNNKKPNRVYFSNPHIPGSYVDGFRNIELTSYRDFALENGDINAIEQLNGFLVIIHEEGINQLYYNEKAIQESNSPGETILGSSIEYLSDRYNPLAEYGTQHLQSILKTPTGIWGCDWNKRIIWRLGGQAGTSGKVFLAAEELETSKMISKWLYDYADEYSEFTDIINQFPDNPIQGRGIVTGYNKKHHEVYFTFLNVSSIVTGSYDTTDSQNHVFNLTNPLSVAFEVGDELDVFVLVSGLWERAYAKIIAYNNNKLTLDLWGTFTFTPGSTCLKLMIGENKTLIFSELSNAFIGESFLISPFYITLNNDFYSFNMLPEDNIVIPRERAYRHDLNNYQSFFGAKYPFKLSFIINGIKVGIEDGKEGNIGEVMKLFKSVGIQMSNQKLTEIIYESLYQTSVYDFNTSDIENSPSYEEHTWKFPITLQTSSELDDFDTDSNMRGYWMKMTIIYHPKTEAEALFIKSVITNMETSHT